MLVPTLSASSKRGRSVRDAFDSAAVPNAALAQQLARPAPNLQSARNPGQVRQLAGRHQAPLSAGYRQPRSGLIHR